MGRQSMSAAEDIEVLKSLPQRRSLGQTAYDRLKHAIVRGDFPAGSHMIENRIAAALGISRTPVREAIHKLEREGLLKRLPTGGYFVVGLSRQDIEETFCIRSVLESYAARLATLRFQEKDLLSMEEKIEEYQACLDGGHLEELARINTEFHDLLYALSQSPKLIEMINGLREPILRFRKILLNVGDMARRSNEDHRMMMACIHRRDAEAVEKLVREHILRGQEVILRHFDSQQKQGTTGDDRHGW